MAVNVDVTRKKNESITQLVRRFTRSFRDTNVVREIKSRRYFQRDSSPLRRKQSALARIEMGKKYAKLRKLGRI